MWTISQAIPTLGRKTYEQNPTFRLELRRGGWSKTDPSRRINPLASQPSWRSSPTVCGPRRRPLPASLVPWGRSHCVATQIKMGNGKQTISALEEGVV